MSKAVQSMQQNYYKSVESQNETRVLKNADLPLETSPKKIISPEKKWLSMR